MADKVYGTLIDDNNGGNYNRRQQGVFGLHPLMTPKYAANKGSRDAEFKESLARLYISLADTSEQTKQAFLAAVPPEAKTLAQVLTSSGQTVATGFIDFFLQQANEAWQEKMQVDETLADNYVAFFFGQQAPVFQYAGTLLNSQQDDQRSGFASAYHHLLRGTALAQRGALARLRYDSVIVSGTMFAHQQTLNADNELAVPFSFSFLVKEYVILQPAKFRKTSQADYVQLATAFANAALLPGAGQAQNVRVRTQMVTPTQPAQQSVVGIEEPTDVTDRTKPAPQQLAAQATQVQQPPSTTTNIRGTVPTTPNPPPAATPVSFNL